MNKHYKFFVIYALVVATMFSMKLYHEGVLTQKIKELSIRYEAESIASFLVAFRATYQDIFIEKHTQIDSSNIDFLPVKTTNQIAELFSTLNVQSKIATVSDRPRNPVNMANERQLKVIEYFKNNGEKASFFQNIGDKYYYSQPLYIDQRCMKCHGKREDAPPMIRDGYNGAYDYSLGELRGIIDIEVKQTQLSMFLDDNYYNKIVSVILFLSVVLIGTFIYASYNKKLEDKLKDEVQKNEEHQLMMLQQSRMAQMGEMISMIAHQWRQPLNNLALLTQTLTHKYKKGKLTEAALDEFNNNANKQIQGMSKTINDFRDFFKSEKKRVDYCINDVIMDTVAMLNPILSKYNLHVNFSNDVKLYTNGFPNELGQAVVNIINNAKDALAEKEIHKRKIEITLEEVDGDISLKIKDNAGGIPEEIIDEIFNPYFSTKSAKEGTGLGLYMTKLIVEEHAGGTIRVSNGDGGACFEIILRGNH